MAMRHIDIDTTQRVVLRTEQQSGDYTVSIEDANGCRATSAKFTVTINRAPSKPTIQRRGDTLRSTTLGGVTSFQWRLNDVDIPGATSREYLPKVSGAYRVFVKNDAGCSNLSDAVDVTVTSVDESDVLPSVVISPNPTSSEVMVQIAQPNTQDIAIMIMNVAGERVGAEHLIIAR